MTDDATAELPEHGRRNRALHSIGFEVEDLIEVRPPPDATTSWNLVTPEWAQRWPVEEVWKARNRG